MINDTGQPANVLNLLLSFFKSIDCGNSISVNKSVKNTSILNYLIQQVDTDQQSSDGEDSKKKNM